MKNYLIKCFVSFIYITIVPMLFGVECGPKFISKGCETEKVTVGGHLATVYQWIDLKDCENGDLDPIRYNNFQVQHMRLILNSELGCGWSGNIDVDLSGAVGIDCRCSSQSELAVFNMYIQKVWSDSTWRFGYQKVQWGMEFNTPKQSIKTVERSIATNFFMGLGRRAYGGTERSYQYTGESFGGRHTGIFVSGKLEDVQYYVSIVNGYGGICGNSTFRNNELAYYLGLSYGFDCNGAKVTVGVNSGYMPKGTNVNASPDKKIYGINPYLLVKCNEWDVLSEFFWANLEESKVTTAVGSACPWGVNIIPAYTLNECWELVGRFSYVNSDSRGMTVHQAFGCAPDSGVVKGGSAATEVASDVLFEKAYATYFGINRYMVNKAVRATFGVEQVRFVNRANGASVKDGLLFSDSGNYGAKLNVVRANLQILF